MVPFAACLLGQLGPEDHGICQPDYCVLSMLWGLQIKALYLATLYWIQGPKFQSSFHNKAAMELWTLEDGRKKEGLKITASGNQLSKIHFLPSVRSK